MKISLGITVRVAGGKTLNLRGSRNSRLQTMSLKADRRPTVSELLPSTRYKHSGLNHRIPMHHPCTPSAVN